MTELQEWLATARQGDGPPDTEDDLRAVESQINFRLPSAVRWVLNVAHRPEGFLGESYIGFLSARDIANCWGAVQTMAPGFVPFASNAAGEWYGVDSRPTTLAFVLLPSIGADWAAAMLLGLAWDEFWETLKRGNLFGRTYEPAEG